MENKDDFDASAAPPFHIADIRAAIPKHSASYLNTWFFWPLYWVAQGTIFWALFVLGHDCGHGSFSHDPVLNNVVEQILHSAILVRYHGWRLSHKTHHQNHGNVEKDESWVPESLDDPDIFKKFLCGSGALLKWHRSPEKTGSHFNPYSTLFSPQDRKPLQLDCNGRSPCLFLFCVWFIHDIHHHGYERKLPSYRGKAESKGYQVKVQGSWNVIVE
ncbi:Detected protein of unknown function [Hibiscus syriacus]|uniref:Fatty acid desaturase domain-containing protein n=1 Tax=Hibiscus syriacus TaxID=106335 RepID=A0A6A3AQV7_HIBSY|nr:Detected protein of unknown function [Hibiscus syriacus]